VQGFEDLRPFVWRDALWGVACVRELNAEGWCEQVIARIDEGPDGPARLTDWRLVRPRGPRGHEKNWMPFVDGGELRFLHLCDPTRVIDEAGEILREAAPMIDANRFRGGSQLIEFGGGRLALIHETSWRDNRRVYRHRFVWFDAAMALVGVSRPFVFHAPGVEFAAGLAWGLGPEQLVITYGVSDREAWIATVNAEDISQLLDDARSLPNGAPEGRRPASRSRPWRAEALESAE
jgi:hypothetical protein